MNESEKLKKPDDSAKEKDCLLPLEMRPPKELSFRPDSIKEIIGNILNEELSGKIYHLKEADDWCAQMKEKLKITVRGLIHEDYKLVTHIILGEQRGAGIRLVARCLWDSENDKVASATFENETIFCVASIFAVYFY